MVVAVAVAVAVAVVEEDEDEDEEEPPGCFATTRPTVLTRADDAAPDTIPPPQYAATFPEKPPCLQQD